MKMSSDRLPLTFQYHVTLDDVLRASVLANRNNAVILRRKRVVVALLCAFYAFFLAWTLMVEGWVVFAVLAFVALGCLAMSDRIFWSSITRQLRRFVYADPSNAGERRLEFTEEGIRKTGGPMDVSMPWSTVRRLIMGESSMVFANAGGLAVVFVPRHAFGETTAEAQFRTAVEHLSGLKFEESSY